MNVITRGGAVASPQVGIFEVVPSLVGQDFKPVKDGNPVGFLIKNDGTDNVTLEIKALQSGEAWVSTIFTPGWNVEIIREIKANATAGLNLKYGY